MAQAPPRSVGDSRSSVVRRMVPVDTNFPGTVFRGAILAEVDRVAYVTATRRAHQSCVTASLDRVDFHVPVRPLLLTTEEERLRFAEGERRMKDRRRSRGAAPPR